MDYNYILLADNRFISYAVSELKRIFSVEGRVKTMALGRGIYLARIDVPPEKTMDGMRSATFSYGIAPLADMVEGPDSEDKLMERVSRIVSKDEPFRLELVSLGARREESAKDTEVRIGKALEAQGFRVSLTEPKRVVYLIIGEGISILASAKSSQLADITIDHFRLEDKNRDSLNRAEIKLKEAFSAFGLADEKVASCIDVGAAPGGWTNFMVKRESRVIAIDRGALEYDKLSTKDVKVVESLKEYEEGHAVLHIRSNLQDDEDLPLKDVSMDMLAIDTNNDYLESSKTAVALSRYLKRGGILIMTLKLPEISDAGRVYMATDVLAKDYRVERIKKLHHNRMELTLFARRL